MHAELEFRFNSVEYEVEENDGFVGVDITFTHGIPGDYQPSITLSINNGTATGQVHIRSAACFTGYLQLCVDCSLLTTEGIDFTVPEMSQVTFTSGNRLKSLIIHIITDNSTEGSKEFTVTLDKVILTNSVNGNTPNLTDQERARLILDSRAANIIILDNNGTINNYAVCLVITFLHDTQWPLLVS